MKASPGTPLDVTLRWDIDDVRPVGRLAYRDRTAWLEYDRDFLASGLDLSPFRHETAPGLHGPHQAGVFEGLHGVFNDSLPDGWGRLLVDRRARQLGIEPATLTPLDRLACVGDGGIGALCYAPAADAWGAGEGFLDLDRLASDTRRVLAGDAGDVLAALGRVGGSPGGACPKALVALNERLEAVHGASETPPGYEAYLVKFPGPDDPEDIANVEMAYSAMARKAGVVMAETLLLDGREGRNYFATRRFDREGTRRRHVHSASGLLYADFRLSALDYRNLVLLTGKMTRDVRASRQMFTLAAFNVLAHNRDDHARQFSYLMDRDGAWRLAPAYDLTFAHGPGGEHATSILGHGADVGREQLVALGRLAELGERETWSVIERVEDAVAAWTTFAAGHGVGRDSTNAVADALNRAKLS